MHFRWTWAQEGFSYHQCALSTRIKAPTEATTDIFVPPEQVIDTVDLYFIRARQRRLSLRFLTWYILKEDIQQDTHDSIEDARSALLLYKMYQKFEEEHIFDEKLEELYRVGKEYVCHSWTFQRAGTDYKYGIELETARCWA